jgi:hypothetical protein
MEVNLATLITRQYAQPPERRLFLGGSDARATMSVDETALVRLWTGDHTLTHIAKSPMAHPEFLPPIGGKYSRACHRQRQPAAKLTTFTTGIRSFLKAYAILWQKLYARFSEHAFNQGSRVLVSCVATDLDIRNRVSMKTGRLSQVPNRPIQRSARHPNLCACHRHETVPLSHVTKSHLISPCGRINGGSSELQVI